MELEALGKLQFLEDFPQNHEELLASFSRIFEFVSF
jgi:hypothetical protein